MCKTGQEHCRKCQSKKDLTIDHIVPITILKQFLLEDEIFELESNFQILCKYCNHMKADRLDLRDIWTYKIFHHIIEKSKKEYLSETNLIQKEKEQPRTQKDSFEKEEPHS